MKWTPRLKAAWEAALAVRAQTLARPSNKGRPIPIRPERRFIFLSESGTPLTRAGLDNAWQDLIHAAMDAEVIAREQRFTLHGLKHRGITDIPQTAEPDHHLSAVLGVSPPISQP